MHILASLATSMRRSKVTTPAEPLAVVTLHALGATFHIDATCWADDDDEPEEILRSVRTAITTGRHNAVAPLRLVGGGYLLPELAHTTATYALALGPRPD